MKYSRWLMRGLIIGTTIVLAPFAPFYHARKAPKFIWQGFNMAYHDFCYRIIEDVRGIRTLWQITTKTE